MLSVLRVATPATTLKITPPPLQHGPFSPIYKRATFTAAISDASNLPVGQASPPDHRLPIAMCPSPLRKVHITTDTHQLSFLTQPLPVPGISDTDYISTATLSTCTALTVHQSSSSFPVHGPFDLLYCIQKGAFGFAWAAKDHRTGRLLCLKIFRPLQDPDVNRSVKMELRMFRRMVKSKGGERGKQFIIELNRSIQHGVTVLFAMELMTTDLMVYMCTDPERCRMHARQWMAQIALGIQSLHEMGIIHRDIKSENILVDSRENVRIIDFGLAYLDPSGEPLSSENVYAAEFLGTPSYMAPEVLQNKDVPHHRRRRYGIAVDWWALGCILFELELPRYPILFDTEEDVQAYISWSQKPSQFEQTYSRFEGLDQITLNLLEGLLRVEPSARFSLSDMEKHGYFRHHDGTSEFDDATVRALAKPIRPELVPRLTDDDKPVEVIGAARLSTIYDWTNLRWAP